MDQPALLDAALDYARRGLPVFPCWPILPMLPPHTGFLCGCGKLTCEHQGKHPLGALAPNGLSNASADEIKVRHWWTARPDANVAIATGPVIVLDVDPRHHGDASLAELEHQHGALPNTARVHTGGGGLHVYLQPPRRESRSKTAAANSHPVSMSAEPAAMCSRRHPGMSQAIITNGFPAAMAVRQCPLG
jgi:hypothetical protein